MNQDRNLLREKLSEFISKLGHNHEIDEDDPRQSAKKITPKTCDRRADFWCKHLSSNRNAKVMEKVEGFCAEITFNIGAYLAHKYGVSVFENEKWLSFNPNRLGSSASTQPHELFLKAKSSVRFASLVFSKINTKSSSTNFQALYQYLAEQSSQDLSKMLIRAHSLELETAQVKEQNSVEVPEFLMVVVGLRLREAITSFYHLMGAQLKQEEKQIESDKRKVLTYYNQYPASLLDAVEERVIFDEPGSEYGYDTENNNPAYGTDLYYQHQESEVGKTSKLHGVLDKSARQGSQGNFQASNSTLFENQLNLLQDVKSEPELENQAIMLINDHQDIMTSPVGKLKSILYRLNLCALAMKGTVNGNSDLEPKLAVNLITHCLLINLAELEEIVSSSGFENHSVPEMNRKLFALHNQLGNFMKNDFPEKAQKEENIELLLQFLNNAFYKIYENLDLSSAVKVNSLSFDQGTASSISQSLSRLNTLPPIDRFSSERNHTRDSAFDSFKKPKPHEDSPAQQNVPGLNSFPTKTKVRSNSLFPSYDGTPTSKSGKQMINFKKKQNLIEENENPMTFGKQLRKGGQSTPPRFRDTPARRFNPSPKNLVNSDSELEEMAENIAKFKNFKRKTIDSGGFLNVIRNSGIRDLKTPSKKLDYLDLKNWNYMFKVPKNSQIKDISISSKYKRTLEPPRAKFSRKRSNFTTMKVSISGNANQNNSVFSAQPSRTRIGGLGGSTQIKRSINLGFNKTSGARPSTDGKKTMRSGLMKFSRKNRFMTRSGVGSSLSAQKNRFSTVQSNISGNSGMTLNFRQNFAPGRSVFDSIQPGRPSHQYV